MASKAICLLETYGYIGAVIALDTALKCSKVKLMSWELIKGGIVTVTIVGDVSAVQCAEDAARASVQSQGIGITTIIIPRLSEEVELVIYDNVKVGTIEEKKLGNLYNKNYIDKGEFKDEILYSTESLNLMKVKELRTLARQVNIKTIERNMIKFSKKKELIQAIMLTLEGSENR